MKYANQVNFFLMILACGIGAYALSQTFLAPTAEPQVILPPPVQAPPPSAQVVEESMRPGLAGAPPLRPSPGAARRPVRQQSEPSNDFTDSEGFETPPQEDFSEFEPEDQPIRPSPRQETQIITTGGTAPRLPDLEESQLRRGDIDAESGFPSQTGDSPDEGEVIQPQIMSDELRQALEEQGVVVPPSQVAPARRTRPAPQRPPARSSVPEQRPPLEG